jgi:diguanylate cyclase (GGDEF)-like protein
MPSVLQPAPQVRSYPTVKGALGRRLIGRIVLVFLAVGVLVSALSYFALNRSFDSFERSAAAETLKRVQTVLRRDSQTLGGVVVDYAYWDELYAFMSEQRDGFMDENFTVASMRNLQVHAAVVFDLAGEVLGARFSHNGQLGNELPASWMAYLTGSAVAQACTTVGHALIWAEDDPLSVVFAPIRNTTVDRPSRGCFVLVRRLDSTYRASVAELVGVDFTLLRAPGLPTSQHRLADGEWLAQAALTPWPASLSIEHPPSLDDERAWIMALMTGGQVVLSLVAIGVLYALLHLMVVRRLTHFSSLADDYRQTHDASISWPISGRDEIDNLGHSLNELVKQVHWQVDYQATHDSLTGLLNRQGLERVLSKLPFHALEQRSRTICLLMIDLDNFKVVNDGFGHDVGDALLRHVAAQLTAAVREDDVVARLGGDEFAILLHEGYRESVDEFVQRILSNIRVPLTHAELEVATSGSIGLAFCDGVASSAELLRNADLAMYQAKQQGRDICAHFNEDYKVEAQRRNMVEQALRLAVRDNAIQVVFQPVVDVVSQRVVGIEALARWSLDGEAIAPSEFIPIAEEIGLIGKLGLQVLERSCAMVAHLRALGHHVPCSVNLSMRQFVDSNLVVDVPRIVFAHGLPAASIRLEITESLVAQSDAALTLAMTDLYRLGFEFLLDDFGTGHSSLYRLQTLPFQTIKIDRSFVIPLERGDDVMVRTVRELARDLNLQVVAEGVETQTQLDQLVALDVHRIQGYLIARPMSDAALLHWMSTTSYACLDVAG